MNARRAGGRQPPNVLDFTYDEQSRTSERDKGAGHTFVHSHDCEHVGQFQFGVASSLGISSALIVAVQAVGAAAGNMVAIHNVVAASATVGLLGREGSTLRKTIWPTLYYLLFTGIIAMVAIYVLGVSDPLMPH